MDIENYVAECERQLNDTSSYKRLENNPTQKNKKLVNDTIEQFKNNKFIIQLTQERRSFMQHEKIHKRTTQADKSSV